MLEPDIGGKSPVQGPLHVALIRPWKFWLAVWKTPDVPSWSYRKLSQGHENREFALKLQFTFSGLEICDIPTDGPGVCYARKLAEGYNALAHAHHQPAVDRTKLCDVVQAGLLAHDTGSMHAG